MKSSRLTSIVLVTMVALFGVVTILGNVVSANALENVPPDAPTSQFAQANEPTVPDALQQVPDQSDQSPDAAAADAQAAQQTPQPTASCESSFPGMGWILCGITRTIYGFFDWLVKSVLEDRLLKVDLIENEPALRQAWEGFKSVANLVFVIAFLVIIYAEATGRFGILETYSVQRLLPRLAFAVIGIQLSFFIVGYLIQLFNDLGAGSSALVLAPVHGLDQFQLNGVFSDLTNNSSFFGLPLEGGGQLVDNILAVFVAGGLGIAAIIFLPTLLLFGSLGLLLLFLTLIARKIVIIALVIMAPLAFAMYVLPATEKLFKQWWDIFIRTLAMYPIIMIFIASGQLLGRLAIARENTTFIDSTIGFVATFLPLFLIPASFRLAGQAIGSISGMLKSANEKIKGDPRDPRSIRSTLRDGRGRDWNRMMQGNKRGIPAFARRGLKRLPFIDSNAPLVADMAEGKKWFEGYAELGNDDLFRAITVTGGGRWRGESIAHANGSSYTGWLKHDKRFARDENTGEIKKSTSGGAMLLDHNGIEYAATADDFYSEELMAQVKSMQMSRGRLTYAAVYTMSKSPSEYTQGQVWHGLRASRWKPAELQDYVNTVWHGNKREFLHNKFLDYDYFERKPGRNQDAAVELMNASPQRQRKAFKDMVEYVDQKVTGYELTQQSGSFWRFARDGLKATDVSSLSNIERKQVRGLYDKARSSTIERAAMREYNEEGEPIGYSQATAEAIREMKKFISVYEDKFPSGDT